MHYGNHVINEKPMITHLPGIKQLPMVAEILHTSVKTNYGIADRNKLLLQVPQILKEPKTVQHGLPGIKKLMCLIRPYSGSSRCFPYFLKQFYIPPSSCSCSLSLLHILE